MDNQESNQASPEDSVPVSLTAEPTSDDENRCAHAICHIQGEVKIVRAEKPEI
jgi:hypothetical protein